MAENIGIVLKTEANDTAEVLLDRHSGCSGCQSIDGGCSSCRTSAQKMQSRVANPVGARVGDVVKIRLSSGSLFAGAAILYLIPMVCLLAGAFAGSWLSAMLNITELPGSILGAVCGLMLGFALVALIDRSAGIRARLTPTIIAIVTPIIGVPAKHHTPYR
jgi:sigma-E factor negative regulatory protein RseC